MANKGVVIGIVLVAIIIIAGFFFLGKDTSSEIIIPIETPTWMEFELKDINSGETFKISDFKGKPVLLESFAVWCPFCTKQQEETKKLHEEVGDSVISISIDTDPNEDESKVLEHTQENGFTWRYAISPTELTQSLIDEFGVSIVNAPSVPMILVCEDGSFKKLGSGVKKVNELKAEIANCQN